MTVATLASGSSGNSCLISQGHTHILVDAGISARQITLRLASFGIAPEELTGVLITHDHIDHISGLSALFRKYQLPIWCSWGTERRLAGRFPVLQQALHIIRPDQPLQLGELTVTGFSTLHDAAESMGFTLSDQVRKAAVVTDLGAVTPGVLRAVEGAGLLVAEANYDLEMLRRGPYPPALQERIHGWFGHLSNAACGQLCAAVKPKIVLLAHLSQENNTPALALETVQAAVGPEVLVEVAPRCQPSRRYELP